MTPDERTILLLAAEALRRPSHTSGGVPMPVNACRLLADALDRIAGETRIGESRVSFHNADEIRAVPDRFTPYSGRCWRCGTDAMGGKARMCSECWGHFPNDPSAYDDTKLRAWIKAEEKGEKP